MILHGWEMTDDEAEEYVNMVYTKLQRHHKNLVGVVDWVRLDFVPTIMESAHRPAFDVSINITMTLPDGVSLIVSRTKSVPKYMFNDSATALVRDTLLCCVRDAIEDIKPKLIMIASQYYDYWKGTEMWCDLAVKEYLGLSPQYLTFNRLGAYGITHLPDTWVYINRGHA